MKYKSLKNKSSKKIIRDKIGIKNPNWNGGKTRGLCYLCGNVVFRWKSQILPHGKLFCSRKCVSEKLKNRIIKICVICKTKFSVIKSRENTAKCCSRVCYVKYMTTLKRAPFSDEHKRKIGMSRIGKKLSIERRKQISDFMKNRILTDTHKLKLSISKIGNKNPAWKGGVCRSPYPFDFNNELKELIRKRDNYKCRNCGTPQEECFYSLAVHHIDFDKNNISPNNLISLCHRCHAKTNWGLKIEKNIKQG